MERNILLAIDIGTTNTKGALFTLDGRILKTASRKHGIQSPQEGWAVHDAEEIWWKEVREVCRELTGSGIVDPAQICSVGISALSPALLPVDRDGKALYPAMLYGLDRRAVQEMTDLQEAGRTILKKEDPGISPLSTGPKILWLKRHEPEIFEKAAYFVGAPTFLVHRLTGEMVADYGCYNIGGFPFSPENFSWDEDMCALCGITAARLPKLKFGTELAGTVTRWAAAETGLAEGTPVAVGTGDFPAECLSFGSRYGSNIRLTLGTTVGINFGTDHGKTVFPEYDFRHPKKTIRGGAMSNGCSTIDWMIGVISGPDAGNRIPDAQLKTYAETVPAGANGLMMLPYLNGERIPFLDPKAKGMLFGLQIGHGPAELYKASLEALAFAIRHVLQRAPADAREAVVVGGGTKIPGLLQVISDVTGFKLTRLEMTNGSLVGDAFISGMACGVFRSFAEIDSWIKVSEVIEPVKENKEAYDPLFEKYLELYQATAAYMHM